MDASRGRQRGQEPSTEPSTVNGTARPPCSTCLGRSITCVPNPSGACKGCRGIRKRCDHSGTLKRTRSPSESLPPPEKVRRRRSASQVSSSSSGHAPSPPPTRQHSPQRVPATLANQDPPMATETPKLPDHGEPDGFGPSSRTRSRAMSSSHRDRQHRATHTRSQHSPPLRTTSTTAPARRLKPRPLSPASTGLRPGPAYSLRGAPLVERSDHDALLERINELEKRVESQQHDIDRLVTHVVELSRVLK